jgi:hypothetical protein
MPKVDDDELAECDEIWEWTYRPPDGRRPLKVRAGVKVECDPRRAGYLAAKQCDAILELLRWASTHHVDPEATESSERAKPVGFACAPVVPPDSR